MRELKITNIFWLPVGSPVQVRIDPVENPPTVGVIPIDGRTLELASLWSSDPHNGQSELGQSNFGHDGKSKVGRSPGVSEN